VTAEGAAVRAARSALVREHARVARLHAERQADPALAQAMNRLGEWQARRLRATYADLAALPRYAGAIAFFQDDLYGSGDFSRRDADLARVAPAMARLVPASVITTVARAMELNALSHELDRALLARLPRSRDDFTVAEYCIAYRHEADYPRRRRQWDLIGEVGAALDRYVRMTMLGTALAMMRRPARLGGFGALQSFLERGFAAFRRMNGAAEFLATIHERESRIHEAIAGGSNAPFPDPWPPPRS
jgi:hypothetical protein